MRLPDLGATFWVFTHLPEAIVTKAVQYEVAFEFRGAPANTTIEELPQLPVRDAAEALRRERGSAVIFDGGVPKDAWSQADQERIVRGESPQGYPEHPNI